MTSSDKSMHSWARRRRYRALSTRARHHWREVGLYKTLADSGPLTRRAREKTNTNGALRPRVAQRAGGRRLRDVQRRTAASTS